MDLAIRCDRSDARKRSRKRVNNPVPWYSPEEAESVYRADLGLDGQFSRSALHVDNVWSLHGLHECLTRRGETIEAKLIKQRLDLATARSNVPVRASCFCRQPQLESQALVGSERKVEHAVPCRLVPW